MDYQKPENPPEHVIILAMGPTWYKCPEKVDENTQIWGVNTMYRNRDVDRIFIMHDIRHDIMMFDKDFIKNVNETGKPIYTAGDYPVFDNNIVYPIKEIIEYHNAAFFLNVMCYQIALAVYEGIKKISMYGADMRTDSGSEYRVNEKGAVEFWLGVAVGHGIELYFPEECYLLRRIMAGNFYGYKPIQKADGLLYMMPENIRRNHRYFRLIPLDDKGEEMREFAVNTTLQVETPSLVE